jgi:uncharacterized repeat protein (TIGR03803 family)
MKKHYLLICAFLCLGIATARAQYKDLFDFEISNTGQYPYGSLTISGNVMYGMASSGGAYDSGCVFSVNTDGTGYQDLVDFNGPNGYLPYYESLILSGNELYGMTSGGGKNDSGCIFSVNINSDVYRDLHDFTESTGFYPTAGLTLSEGVLYGMTQYGGANYGGVFFSIDTTGSGYKDRYDFAYNAEPRNTLVPSVSGKILYGVSASGPDAGMVFSIDTDGTGFKDLHDFAGGAGDTDHMNYSNGNSLTLVDSVLYGTSELGGEPISYGYGFMFSIDTNGKGYKHVYDFTESSETPVGTLVLSGNTFYGMTYDGGAKYLGNIFSIDTNGTKYTDLYDFTGIANRSGADPSSSLTFSGGLLYGMAFQGGYYSYGTIFSFNQNDSTPVWPGDANDDLTVNVFDLLSLGLYYDQTGPARDTPNINTWAPHPAANWGVSQYNGYDLKYADCNGDGIINIADALAILLNYGDTHPNHSPRGSSKERSGGVPLYFIADSSSYHAGSNVHIGVWLGDTTNQAANIYGLAYDIAIDTSLIQSGTLAFNSDSSFIGTTTDTSVLALTHIGDDVETGVVGTNHSNKNGYGKIGDLYLTLSSSITNPQFLISVSSWMAVDAAGDTLTLQPISDTLNVATGINQLLANSNLFSIYPNPTSGQFTINLNSSQNNYTIEVYNVMGEKIYQSVNKSPLGDLGVINLSSQPAGIYFVYLKSQEEVDVGKVLVSK